MPEAAGAALEDDRDRSLFSGRHAVALRGASLLFRLRPFAELIEYE
jgi:hypothetical protein